ncbi:class II glutamine amidotransferase [Rhodoplanes serenus]|jgi:glutamine amidotransferase|uniref:Class II glutamine amidotransferase n=1 Tax=Rhodoplanes serenus TaxID=200615 RepID=A0A327K1S2_9BRAD|nr:class II glutamine amidotransferase [Rhodoplanes serenus]MBI5113475.1 class II glutamine amidotransferase [Rhodovulum sp.]MTW16069.1 class II glutamine amidotransferase [Rhodoplanes serenus]RAI31773.1 class II glutamine amidotransferase [Rhodoplanes serenus]VCU08286.1 Gamma-glutamyl-hercynylcysteine sulfoxide hydrolase [Rhodoplanes serenus]
MCRWIAYRGETIALEHYVTAPARSLVAQSLHALESTASTHGDGFGLGWYGDHPEPGLYREVRPAWSDDNLRYLCRHIRSHLFFAHVRSSTGTPITRPNCHPFACGRWLFMHNGMIGNWNRIRRRVEALIPDELYGSRIGTTDSEAVFLALLGAGLDRDPIGATARTLAAITEMTREEGRAEAMRFTAAVTNGKDLYAFRYAANDQANTLYYRAVGKDVVLVSEPLDEDRSDWQLVPPDHAVVARAGRAPEVVPFTVTRQVAAE